MSRHSDEVVKAEEIHDLLDSFSKNSYRVKGDPRVRNKIKSLFDILSAIQFLAVTTCNSIHSQDLRVSTAVFSPP